MSYYKIRPRSGTATQWATANPILAEREIGYEVPETGFGTGPVRMKMGDGVTPWNNLVYADPETGGGSGEDCLTKADIVNNTETDDPAKVASASALYNLKKDVNDSLSQLGMDLIWTNPTPTVNFSVQTLTLDLSEYKYVKLVCETAISTNRFVTQDGVKGYGGQIQYLSYDSNGTPVLAFRLFDVSESGITISDCLALNQTMNNFCIPVAIYGCK